MVTAINDAIYESTPGNMVGWLAHLLQTI